LHNPSECAFSSGNVGSSIEALPFLMRDFFAMRIGTFADLLPQNAM